MGHQGCVQSGMGHQGCVFKVGWVTKGLFRMGHQGVCVQNEMGHQGVCVQNGMGHQGVCIQNRILFHSYCNADKFLFSELFHNISYTDLPSSPCFRGYEGSSITDKLGVPFQVLHKIKTLLLSWPIGVMVQRKRAMSFGKYDRF